uniref:Adenylate kinase n=1 Tax=Lotharella globosa TaxID=91324 RepID=A0A7S3ZE46_9EUKA
MQKKFFETQLTHTIHAQTKNERMEEHLKKFRDFKVRSDVQRQRLEEALYKLEQQEIQENRYARLETMKRKQRFQKEWEEQGIERWKENQRLARIRRQGELGFELTMKERRRRVKEASRLRDTMEMRSCIDDFERNLDRIGVQDDDESEAVAKEKEEDDLPPEECNSLLEMRERMKAKLPDPRSREIKAVQEMKDIRRRKEADRLARKERTKRRRKVLADQQATSDATEVEEMKITLLETLLVDCKRKRESGQEMWRMQQMKEIMKENARFRRRQIEEALEKERIEEINTGKAALDAVKAKQEAESRALLQRYQEIAQAKAAEKTKHNMIYCKQLALKIVEISAKAAAYRQLSSEQKSPDGLIPKQLWRDWTTLFVNFKPILPSKTMNQSDSDTLMKMQDKEGGLSLEDLKEATRVNDTINENASLLSIPQDGANVVVDAELQRYLNGEGKWRSTPVGCSTLTEVLTAKEGEDPPQLKRNPKDKKKANAEEKPIVDIPALHAEASQAPADFEDPIAAAVLAKIANIIHNTKKCDKKYPIVPKLPLTMCLLGRPYSGKKTQAEILQKRYGIVPIVLDTLIKEAVHSVPNPDDPNAKVPPKKGGTPEEQELAELINLGTEIKSTLEAGGEVSDKMSVSLVIAKINRLKRLREKAKAEATDEEVKEEAEKEDEKEQKGAQIKELPEGLKASEIGGWCLIGFPQTKKQAEIFEKNLSGFDMEDQKGAPKSKLAPPAQEEQRNLETDPYPSGIDIVFRFDCTHPMLLSRVMGQLTDPETGNVYHTLSRPPPDNPEIRKRLTPPLEHDSATSKLSTQVVYYDEQTKDLEQWFSCFGILRPIDVDSNDQPLGQSSEFVADAVSEVVENLLKKRVEAEQNAQKTEEEKAKAEADSKQKHEDAVDKEFSSKKKKVQAANGEAAADEETKEEEGKEDDGKKGEAEGDSKTAEPKLDPAQAVQAIGKYNLEPSIARVLDMGWSKIENRFIQRFAKVTKALQAQKIVQVKHYAKTRENFRSFLKRPANSKTFRIEDFQSDFNGIHMDLRGDPSAKAELHQRVDELAEELWEMTKVRKNEALDELLSILKQGWVERQTYLLTVHCAILMTLEAQRYQGILRIATDFFKSCLGLPLDLSSNGDDNSEPFLSVLEDTAYAPGEEKEDNKGAKGGKGKGKKKAEPQERNVEQEISDVKMEYDYLTPLKKSMDEILSYLMPSEDPSFKLTEQEAPDPKAKGVAPKKKGKKGAEQKKSEALEELKVHVQQATKRAERLLAGVVESQNVQFVQRIRRIFQFCVSIIEEMKKALFQQEYPNLKRDITNRIKGESGAIDTLCEVVRDSIENATPVYHRLLLQGEDIFIDEKHVVKPIPQVPKSSLFDFLSDAALRGRFTPRQLLVLANHFRLDFPSGFVTIPQGVKMLVALARTSYAANPQEGLPQEWRHYSPSKFTALLDLFAPLTISTVVNWREFIVRLSLGVNVMPPTSSELGTLVKAFHAKDQEKTTLVDEKAFTDCLANSSLMQKLFGARNDDLEGIIKVWYLLFKDEENMVDYSVFVLYLCFDSAECSGVDKALIVTDLIEGKETPFETKGQKVFFRGCPEAFQDNFGVLYRGKMKDLVEGHKVIDMDFTKEIILRAGAPFHNCELYKLKNVRDFLKD